MPVRVLRHVLLVLSVLGVWAASACTPDEAERVVAALGAPPPSSTTTTTAAAPACCTPEQARYIEAKEAERRHQAYVDDVRARFARHPLRPIAGCESSYAHRPEGEPVWDRLNQQGSSASGGLQMLDGTYRSWVASYWPEYAGRWARAAHAPDWFQMELGMRAYERQGSTPWRSSRGCWG